MTKIAPMIKITPITTIAQIAPKLLFRLKAVLPAQVRLDYLALVVGNGPAGGDDLGNVTTEEGFRAARRWRLPM